MDWRFPMFSTEEIPVTSYEDENSHEENYSTPSWEPTVEVQSTNTSLKRLISRENETLKLIIHDVKCKLRAIFSLKDEC